MYIRACRVFWGKMTAADRCAKASKADRHLSDGVIQCSLHPNKLEPSDVRNIKFHDAAVRGTIDSIEVGFHVRSWQGSWHCVRSWQGGRLAWLAAASLLLCPTGSLNRTVKTVHRLERISLVRSLQ